MFTKKRIANRKKIVLNKESVYICLLVCLYSLMQLDDRDSRGRSVHSDP